jgi:hypothetical protein
MNPFDYVKAINAKKDLIRESESPALAEKGYDPFLTNRALSYHSDTLWYANEMNQVPNTDKLLQYDYLLHSVRKGKRFSKWFKPTKVEGEDLIMEYYKCNSNRAKEYAKILTIEQIEDIRQKLEKGGN